MEEQVMSNGLNSLSRLPEVDTKNLRERKLLEAELLTLDKQIRNFGQLRDRFSAVGGDANAYYRKVQARTDFSTRAVLVSSLDRATHHCPSSLDLRRDVWLRADGACKRGH